MSRETQYSTKAVQWIQARTLRERNLLWFIQYLMREAATDFPELPGLEKKTLVLNTLDDVLEDHTLPIKSRPSVQLAITKMADSWVTAGIRANKQHYQFKPKNGITARDTQEAIPGDQDYAQVVAQIAAAADQWFTHRVVTASNIIMGIMAIMQAANTFFRGDGQTKKEMVLAVVKEIVNRESTQISDNDREAVLMAIDTFAPTLIDYAVDMATGQFDFKGLIQQFKECCGPFSMCCAPPAPTPIATADSVSL